jgi:hypothetical protein
LEKKLADADVSEEDQSNLLKFLEKKETEYMRLQRHKMGVDDFELLTMIGKGAFGEVYIVRFCNLPGFLFYCSLIFKGFAYGFSNYLYSLDLKCLCFVVSDLECLCVCNRHARVVMIFEAPLCGASKAVTGMIFCENERYLCVSFVFYIYIMCSVNNYVVP